MAVSVKSIPPHTPGDGPPPMSRLGRVSAASRRIFTLLASFRTLPFLPLRCHSVATPLPLRCHSVATPLPLRCHSVATPLPLRCHSVATPLPDPEAPARGQHLRLSSHQETVTTRFMLGWMVQ